MWWCVVVLSLVQMEKIQEEKYEMIQRFRGRLDDEQAVGSLTESDKMLLSQEDGQRSIKLSILNILLVTVRQPSPNFCHLLMGFKLENVGDSVLLLDQDDASILQSVLENLDNSTLPAMAP
eukprot:GFYU01037577.1.p1 GENE.GFYU01037577.1~~GFYU01037577.1.p1  ORF type:complete len:121 (+),score=33.10 GFYU01037577.1:267-629(+)